MNPKRSNSASKKLTTPGGGARLAAIFGDAAFVARNFLLAKICDAKRHSVTVNVTPPLAKEYKFNP
jgi:hypothetical protein